MLFVKVLLPIPMIGGRQMENLQGITIMVMLLGIFSTIFWMVVSAEGKKFGNTHGID